MENKKHFVVLGEICSDIYYYVKKSSDPNPEDPSVPLYKVVKSEFKDGMAKNVANALEKLGNKVTLITDVLEPEIQKIRFIDFETGKMLERVDIDDYPITKKFLTEQEKEDLKSCDAVILCDYGKQFLNDKEHDYSRLYYLSHINKIKKETPIFIDPYKTRTSLDFYLEYLQGFENIYFTPNRSEAKALFSGTDTDKDIVSNMIDYCNIHNNIKFLFKRSEAGMEFIKTGYNYHALAVNKEVKDVCGAGDIALAAFAHLLINYEACPYSEALLFANAAAGISCQHIGNYCPSLEEIQDAIKNR